MTTLFQSALESCLWGTGVRVHELVDTGVDTVRDDLETLVLDADLLDAVADGTEIDTRTRELEIKITTRLRNRLGRPEFKDLSERLKALKDRHDKGLLTSVAFLKELLSLATDVVAKDRDLPPEVAEDHGKASLTELFEEVKNEETPIIVERLVNKIDEIVRVVRFPGWQHTSEGEREVRKALRRTLFDVKLHQDTDLFERAYGYVKQYY